MHWERHRCLDRNPLKDKQLQYRRQLRSFAAEPDASPIGFSTS